MPMNATRTARQSPDIWRKWALMWVMSAAMLLASVQARAEISAFYGAYTGSAEVISYDGTTIPRDMSVEISEVEDGFQVQWTSVSYHADGGVSEKSYAIDFIDSGRGTVYAAAQRKNVFGHEVQLDPMKGEPYVWSRLNEKTLSVYSLFVAPDGGYSLQQYDRTLAEGGLKLKFQVVQNGLIRRAVETFLVRK